MIDQVKVFFVDNVKRIKVIGELLVQVESDLSEIKKGAKS